MCFIDMCELMFQFRAVPIVGSCGDVSEAGSFDAVRAVLPASSEDAVTQPAGLYHGPSAWTRGGCRGI